MEGRNGISRRSEAAGAAGTAKRLTYAQGVREFRDAFSIWQTEIDGKDRIENQTDVCVVCT